MSNRAEQSHVTVSDTALSVTSESRPLIEAQANYEYCTKHAELRLTETEKPLVKLTVL